MTIRNIIFIISLFLLSGCTTTRDISAYPPYRKAIDRKLVLVRPILLEESLLDKDGNNLVIYANPDGSMSRYVISYSAQDADQVLTKAGYADGNLYLIDLAKFVYTKNYTLQDIGDPSRTANMPDVIYPKNKGFLRSATWVLPAGLPVKLERVESINHIEMGPSVMAVVSFVVPESRERIKALYHWGDHQFLSRAPWEEDSVPETRYVSSDGRGYIP